MKNIYTWAAKPAKRTVTVGDLKALKGKKKFTQVTANSTEEASAAEISGFDILPDKKVKNSWRLLRIM